MLENARDGVVILRDGRLVYANDAFTRLVRRDRCALIGTPFAGLLAADQPVPATASGFTGQAFAEQILVRTDGARVPVELSISPVVFRGQEGCVQVVARDVSERTAVLQAQKLRALGQMAAGVAHDFNNALMAILGNLSLARTDGAAASRTLDAGVD